jgi:C4-dicarboxylate-specific signal transduction histidine kinase
MDISERKKAERLIAEQQMMIVQASKMSSLGEMASSIAHEINNPLQVILGRCEILDMIAADPNRKDELVSSVQLIDKMSQRIYKIIRGLQSLARDQRNDAKERADFRDIVRETLALCEQRIKIGVTKFEVPAFKDALMLLCHPTQISQVLLNLLNNSYDEVGGKPGAWIKLEVEQTSDALTFVVADSGGGIPADVADKMFAPFFTTKPVGKGTGIGLSVSKSLIEAHGGTLALDRKAKHTRFVVTLPLAADSKKAG